MNTLILVIAFGGIVGFFYVMHRRRSARPKSGAEHLLARIDVSLRELPFRQRVRRVALGAAGLGLVYGVLHPAIQVAVEQGQVLARIVRYPEDNAFYLYQVKAWNIWAQLSAVGLSLGLNEIAISIFLSTLAGILIFIGLSLILLSITKSPIYSLVGVPIIFGLVQIGQLIGFSGFSYPIVLVGSSHSFGMLGLNYMVLCIGLLAVGETAWAFFLLGFSGAAHVSLGLWTGLTVLASLQTQFRGVRGWLRYVPFGVLGLLLATTSYLIQRTAFPTYDLDVRTAQSYLATYLQVWDVHRISPLENLISNPNNVLLITSLFAIAPSGLARHDDDDPHVGLFVWFMPISSAIAILFTLWSQTKLPLAEFIAVLLPVRFLNLSIVCFFAWLVGVCYNHRAERWVVTLLLISIPALTILTINPSIPRVLGIIPQLLLTAFALTSNTRPLRRWGSAAVLGVALAAAMVYQVLTGVHWGWATSLLLISALAGWTASRVNWRTLEMPRWLSRIREPLLSTNAIALVGLVSTGIVLTLLEAVNDFSNTLYFSPFWAEAARGEGLVVLSSEDFSRTQLKSRRPVLLEAGQLDGLPYAIDGAPQAAAVLSDVYHVDFNTPPAATQHKGMLVELPEVKAVWESRSVAEWQALAAKYGFTQVLGVPGWNLTLPVRATSPTYGTLYDVPPAGY